MHGLIIEQLSQIESVRITPISKGNSIIEIDGISDKVKQLNASKETITNAVEDLGAISEENAAANEEVSASVEEIAGSISAIAEIPLSTVIISVTPSS